jgi:hypothetical protein
MIFLLVQTFSGCNAAPLSESKIEQSLLVTARGIAARPIVKRAYKAGDVEPEYLDTRALDLTSASRCELFSLSMSDFFQTDELSGTMPLLAVAAQIAPDPREREVFRLHLLAQLEEVATWKKLNRPGWTLYRNGAPVAQDYNDGNWLGTGLGVDAIVSTLRVAGDMVAPELRQRLHALLQAEVASVRDDFTTKRVWFYNTPVSNQFVLPNVGVALACVELGKGRGDADYEFSVNNLLRALNAQGADGAHHEGAHYGSFTTREILMVARATAEQGDRRLIEHPHLKNFGFWLLHMMQPGGHIVNISDGIDRILKMENETTPTSKLGSRRFPPSVGILDSLLLWAMTSGDATASDAIRQVFPNLYPNVLGLEYSKWAARQPVTHEKLASFAAFNSSPLVMWRSGWDDKADGVWVRGGSARDSHDHRDRGHVNYIVGGRKVLIEAGSTDYAEIMKSPELYQGASGHNVLQIGTTTAGAQRKGGDCPITVRKLDAGGGDVTIAPTNQYDPKVLKAWSRRVVWNKDGLEVEDDVSLADGVLQTVLFRWHLAADFAVAIAPSDEGKTVSVSWPGGALKLQADAPLEVTATKMPHGITYFSRAMHTCLLVQSAAPIAALHLTTTLRRQDQIK